MNTMIYQLRITLRDSKPPIWRRVAVPSDITLGQLHEVIQIAMGWTNSHLHQFMLQDKSLINRDPGVIARLSDEGRYDDIFAATRGIRVFVAKVTPFGDPTEMEGEDEDAVTLAEVCPKVKSRLTYEYDFGDGWEHTIEVQKIEESKPGVEYPVCLAGKLACPPEDCGGIDGYYHMLDAVSDSDHEEHDDLVEWLGNDFDPEAFDIDEVNDVLTQWREG
jgi:hypothetical protein